MAKRPKKRSVKASNPVARALHKPLFHLRLKPNKKLYQRKAKHRGRIGGLDALFPNTHTSPANVKTPPCQASWYDHIIRFPLPSPRSTVCRHFLGSSGGLSFRSHHYSPVSTQRPSCADVRIASHNCCVSSAVPNVGSVNLPPSTPFRKSASA